MGGFGGKKGKGERCNYIVISKLPSNFNNVALVCMFCHFHKANVGN